jgi:hypothetical protein
MHRSSRGHSRPQWFHFLLVFALVGLTALVISDARTDEQSQITGYPGGVTSPASSAPAAEPAAAPSDQTAIEAPLVNDEARWVRGELIPPLPQDPMRRQQALDQALAGAMAQPNLGMPHAEGAPGGGTVPAGFRSPRDPLPNIEPFVPADVKRGEHSYNLKLPDEFVAPPELVRGVDENGQPLPQNTLDEGVTAALAPALKQTFDGISQTNLTPPDCDAAVGPNHVIAVVNARFAIYDKCGTNLYENNIASFVGDAVNFFFDPKVLYDVWSGRWIITCCVRNSPITSSWVIMLVSNNSDPFSGWCWYYLDFQLNGGTPTDWWADYQDVGTSPDGIHITANMFNLSSPAIFQYSKIRNIDKDGVFACGGICWWDFWSLTNPADGSLAFTLRPADMDSWGGTYYLLNSVSFGGNFLTLWKLTGDICSGPSLVSTNLPVPVYDDPPAGQQPDLTFVDSGDARLINAAYKFSQLWACHSRRINWGEPADRAALGAFQVDPIANTVGFSGGLGASGLYYAYPAVDFDYSNRGIVAFSRVGTAENPGSRYVDLNLGVWGVSNLLAAGLSSYNGSPDAGTSGDPFRWGDYYGCDLDLFDSVSLWFYGQYTVNPFAWDTQVGAAAPVGNGILTVTPSPGLVSGGFQGGPFNPNAVTYTVQNTGSSSLTWTLSGLAAWNNASATSGQLNGGDSQLVTVSINAVANAFVPGVYVDSYSFEDCYSNLIAGRSTTLHVGVSGACDGDKLELFPSTPFDVFGADVSTLERGVYVTAEKDIVLCSVGYKMQLPSLPQTLEARIYAANGTTRGALLASNSIGAVQLANEVIYIPINYTLLECQDYEIVVLVPANAAWEWWNENLLAEPFDVGGAIRVRDASLAGNSGNVALPHIELITDRVGVARSSDLAGPGAPNVAPDDFQERGVFVHMLDTAQLSTFGWEADLVPGQTLVARVYDAVGVVRGAVVAEATLDVTLGGMRWHDVVLNAQLSEGKDYLFAIEFGLTNSWNWWDENVIPIPFNKDVYQVVTSDGPGGPGNFALPHYRAGWEEKTGGNQVNLAKNTDVFPPPNVTSQDNSTYGAYITSLVRQQVYGLGWMADVPSGLPITARVYEAVGNVRGALISEGTIYSSGDGMRYHDVPVAAELLAGTDYDIAIAWTSVTTWRWWSDTFGLPYTSYGVIQVRNGEAAGNAGNTALIHMDIYACDEVLTPVDDDPPQRTPLFLAVPAPNPISTSARLDFALEEEGPVNISVYDVAGRRVTTLLEGQRPKGWNSVDIDASKMASGVYFIKMTSKTASLSRKFVVTH